VKVGFFTRLDVSTRLFAVAILLQQRRDGLARRGGVGDCEFALGVLVLRVDYDQRAVAGRGGLALLELISIRCLRLEIAWWPCVLKQVARSRGAVGSVRMP